MALVEFGFSHFGAKPYAYKRAYCPSCQKPRVFVQLRWFAWAHLFVVPLIPLGYDAKWFCRDCEHELKSPRETSLPPKLVFLPFYLFIGIGLLFLGDMGLSQEWLITLRSLFIAGLAYLGYTIVLHWQRVIKKEVEDALPLDSATNCAICGGHLEATPRLQCQSCKLRVIHPPEQPPHPTPKWLGWHWDTVKYHGLFSVGGKADYTRRPQGRKMMFVAMAVGFAGVVTIKILPHPDMGYTIGWIMIVFGIFRFVQGVSYYYFKS